MRRIIASVNISLDGFVAGPNGEMDWHTQHWTAGMAERLCLQLSKADTILLGRNTYTAMATYWPKMNRDLCYPREDLAFAGMMNEYDKVVVSKTLKKPKWNNTIILSGNIHDQLEELRNRPGKDIIVLGSITLLRYLLQNRLVEELLLWLHPVALGRGIPLFDEGKIELRLLSERRFGSGVVLFCYGVSDQDE